MDPLNIVEKGISYLCHYLKLFSGSWCFIIENEDSMLAAVDRVRSKPIFIKIDNKNAKLSTKIYELRKNSDLKNIQKDALRYYENNRIAPPSKTLDSTIKVLRPCSYIDITGNQKNIIQYEELPEPLLNKKTCNRYFKISFT